MVVKNTSAGVNSCLGSNASLIKELCELQQVTYLLCGFFTYKLRIDRPPKGYVLVRLAPTRFPVLGTYGTLNGYAFIPTYSEHTSSRPAGYLPKPAPGFSHRPSGVTETLLCSALLWDGRSGAERGGTTQMSGCRASVAQRPQPRFPCGRAWRGRGENRRQSHPWRPQAKGGSPRR